MPTSVRAHDRGDHKPIGDAYCCAPKEPNIAAGYQQGDIDDDEETRCDSGGIGSVASVPRWKPAWINEFLEHVKDCRS
jgi:hypothetical protein